jgi:putative ABC transport system permease protein
MSADHVRERRPKLGDRLHALWRDVRYAARGLSRRPLYSAVIIATMALAIGANTAIFSVLDAVLLHPFPVKDLDRVVALSDEFKALDLHDTSMGPIEVDDLRVRTDVFAAVAGVTGQSFMLTRANTPQRVVASATLGDFFGLFAQEPALGRFYTADESPNAEHLVAVLSYGLWQELFGGDRSVIGKLIELNGRSYEIVGVARPEFQYPVTTRLWVPYYLSPRMREQNQRGTLIMNAVARLRPGVSLEQAVQAMHVQANRWNEEYYSDANETRFGHDIIVRPFVDRLAGDLKPILLVLMGAVVFVLLIACANVGSLQLVRANGRMRELAVRAALGAGRWAIARQLMIESVVLAALGGLMGVLIAFALLRPLASLNAAQVQLLQRAHLNGAVLAFTAFMTIGAGLLFGIAPSLRAGRLDLQHVIKESGRGSSAGVSRHRFLQSAVIIQVALCLTLLLGATFTVRSLARLLDVSPGFAPAHVLTMRIAPQSPSWQKEAAGRPELLRQLRERIAAIPGVQAVGMSAGVPFADGCSSTPFRIAGMEPQPGDPEWHANFCMIDGDYFKAMGILLLRGRGIEPTDREGSPLVAVIDDQLADHYFHGQDPIGRRISQGRDAEIVGIVHRVDQSKLAEPRKPLVYYAFAQGPWWNAMVIAIRTTVDDATMTRLVRSAVSEIEPRAPIWDVMSMTQRIDRSVGARRLAMTVLSGFAALSLVLAVLGIYGLLSYSTSQRTHEIGIRMALGANSAGVTRMVLWNGLTMAALGVLAGTVAFLGLGQALSALLYGIGPHDPVTMVGGVVVVGIVAAVASYVPARRAARVDPLVTLRD